MLSENIRLIALDFETTGLDINSDVPIQIGLLEASPDGSIVGGYQSLIHPKKDIKELKSIVGFITGLSVEKLEKAPQCEEIEKELAPFFGENTIVIGHNIGFDLAFLKKFFPNLHRKTSIDTFRLSQALIHYAPSYALEILVETLQDKQNFQEILKRIQPFVGENENFHDAFYDSKLTIALFQYLIEKIESLITDYPILDILTQESSCPLTDIFKKKSITSLFPIEVPPLKKIMGSNTQMLEGTHRISLTNEQHGNKYLVDNVGLKELLSSLVTNKQCIFAFSNKSKLDIAKNILNELGIKNIGFVKEEQTINSEMLNRFINKGSFDENEYYFILKYFSHVQQGLGILDLDSKGDFEIYTAIKDQRETINYPVILATHGGLFSLLEQKEKYQGYTIIFFDVERWYKSYNFYLSRSYDLNYTLNYLDMISYKFKLQYEVEKKDEILRNGEIFEEFKQFFTVFTGILGQETKAFFTNTDATIQTLEPLVGNVAFYQTNKLLEKFDERKDKLENILQKGEFTTIWKQIEHMFKIFEGMMTVEKKMWSRSDFYFVYAEDVKFTNREEFLDEITPYPIIFLSNNDQSLPYLIPNNSDDGTTLDQEKTLNDDRIKHLSKTPSILKFMEEINSNKKPNECIFILSVKKDESIALFEELIAHGYDKSFLLLVENITGGIGKNVFKAKQIGTKIIIGGYNFLLQLFAQKIAISQLIIYNNKGNQQDLIYSDILRYGKEALN